MDRRAQDAGRHADGNGPCNDFSGSLTPVRILRNRIGHHERVFALNLARHRGATGSTTSPPST